MYQPAAESGTQLTRHPGLEMWLVLENCLDVHVGFEVNVLMQGDSITFPAPLPHRFVNPTDHASRAIAIVARDLRAAM